MEPRRVCPKAFAQKHLLEPKCIYWRPGMWAYEAERGAVKRTGGTGGQSPTFQRQSRLRARRAASAVGKREGERQPRGVASVEGSIRGRQHLRTAKTLGPIGGLRPIEGGRKGGGFGLSGRPSPEVRLTAKCGLSRSAVYCGFRCPRLAVRPVGNALKGTKRAALFLP
jgi:hypothetical protein